jgi:uncharacterized protein YcbX
MPHILIGKTPQEALAQGYVVNDFTNGEWSSTKTNVELHYGVIVKVWPSFFTSKSYPSERSSFFSTFFGLSLQSRSEEQQQQHQHQQQNQIQLTPELHHDRYQDDAESWVLQRLQT